MKRLIAFLIVISVILSLFGCVTPNEPEETPSVLSSENESNTEDTDNEDKNETGNSTASSSKNDNEGTTDSTISSTGNDENKNDTTDSSTTSSSKPDDENKDDNNTGGNTKPTQPSEPVFAPDRTKYQASTVGSGDNKALYYINEVVKFPYITPYYNGYKTALTMTFDDGYDLGTGTVVSDQFEKYGFRGTMMLGVSFINNDTAIEEWNKVFARGYLDLGCHGYDHLQPEGLDSSKFEHEIKDAIMFLREKFPGQRVLTFATPYAKITNSYESYLKDFVIGNRLESGGGRVILGSEFNPYRVQAISVNANANLSTVHNVVSNSIKNGAWTVELFHCVKDKASGVDMDREVFEFHCKWLYKKYRDDIWFATFEEVLIYAKQLEGASVEYTDCDRESMTFTVTPDLSLDMSIYNIPLSLKVYLPNEIADSAYAVIDGVYQPLDIEYEQSTAYMYTIVRNIPADKVTDVKVYMGGNKTMKNNCVHKYSVDSVVEPTHDTFGYTVNKCSICKHTYNSAYTAVVHDFTYNPTVMTEPTEREKGLTKFFCTQCDKFEVREIEYRAE